MVQAILRLPAELVESKSIEEWELILSKCETAPKGPGLTYEMIAEFLYFSWTGDTGYYIAEEVPEEFYDQIDDSIRTWVDNEVGLPNLEEGFSVGEQPGTRYVRG